MAISPYLSTIIVVGFLAPARLINLHYGRAGINRNVIFFRRHPERVPRLVGPGGTPGQYEIKQKIPHPEGVRPKPIL
jgi:hypothetical protein